MKATLEQSEKELEEIFSEGNENQIREKITKLKAEIGNSALENIAPKSSLKEPPPLGASNLLDIANGKSHTLDNKTATRVDKKGKWWKQFRPHL